ncbi:hypothetical protein, variant [Aphanomyces astaci]|uniref:Uncharacterized protein n=1 Tax=Aphanomyces astaci TaxID=112090 RepID=W4H1I5_APHAT|nr:hypothetical protein, variant [Aphanomyces astaci]ETV85018.1 hypothetical protein, variant [Aphanomyces astaci]|eukprot:XP_009825036.1 hypothetical protein, variant [Aphanomyces astaci]
MDVRYGRHHVPPSSVVAPVKGSKKGVGVTAVDIGQISKLPVVPNARSRPPQQSAGVTDAALTTVFKSDVMLLQLKCEKLERLWGTRDSQSPPTCDHDIRAIVAQTSNVEAILAREKYASMAEAVCKLSLKIELNDLVGRKMQAVETLVLQNTAMAPTPEQWTLPSTVTLSRLPTFLALIDRLVQLHSTVARLAVAPPQSAKSYEPHNNAPPEVVVSIEPHGKEEALRAHIQQLQCELAHTATDLLTKHRVAENRWHRELEVLKHECAALNNTIMGLHEEVDVTKRALRHTTQELETASLKLELLQQECQRHDTTMKTLVGENEEMVNQLRDRHATATAHWTAELDGIHRRFQTQLEEVHAQQRAQQQQSDESHATQLQSALDKVATLEDSTYELKGLVTTLTEEDDALVQRIEHWLASVEGPTVSPELALDVDGISALKVAKPLARAFQVLAAVVPSVAASDARQSTTRQFERELLVALGEVAQANETISSLEALAQTRWEVIEQLRAQLDEWTVQRGMKEMALQQSITSLNQEIACQLDCIDQLQKDKRALVQSQCNDSEVDGFTEEG